MFSSVTITIKVHKFTALYALYTDPPAEQHAIVATNYQQKPNLNVMPTKTQTNIQRK